MTHASLFSGIGGPEVAAAMLGWENLFHCEINPFGRKVLEYWFPDSVSYEDITKTSFKEWRGKVDVLTGGFPCQPFSYAGKRGGQKTHVISGRKCSGLLTKSGPLGSLVKTLLVSPLWSKDGFRLKWDAVPLYSRRVLTFTTGSSSKPSPSKGLLASSKVSDIPSSRSLFRLRLVGLPTEEIESSYLPLMQTPTAVMTCEAPEKNGYKNGTKYGSLESQIKYDPRVRELLPTPNTTDYNTAWSEEAKEACLKRRAQEGKAAYPMKFNSLRQRAREMLLPTPQAGEGEHYRNTYTPGSQMGTSLSAMAGSGMLPTPTARDEKNPSSPDGKRIARKMEQGWTIELLDLAAMGNLPTPSARDWKGKTNPGQIKEWSGCVYGETLPDAIGRVCAPEKDGPAFRLSPLFTEEMMGFPLMWTTLPFLSQAGAPNPSKPTETQSCRK